MKGLVLYCDAGTRPNPGPSGYGIHGYHYDSTLVFKPVGLGSIWPTTQGYQEKDKAKEGTTSTDVVELTVDDIIEKKKCVAVTPTQYVDMFGTVSSVINGLTMVTASTNNKAEVRAATMALRYILEADIECAVVLTDSEYTVKGITEWLPGWLKRNWIRQDGSPVVNNDAWKELNEVLVQVREKNIPVKFLWVRGHNDDTGNERADKLATMGVFTAMRGKDYHAVDTQPPEGFWKYASEKHPFIAHRYCYFNTLHGATVAGDYYLGNHGKVTELIGNRMSDGTFSVVRIKEPDPTLEMIRNYQAAVSFSSDMLYIAHLDKIFSPTIHEDLNTYGELVIEPCIGQRTDLKTFGKNINDGILLTEELNPARISMRAVDSLTLLSDVLDQFLNNGHELTVTNITDSIYEKTSKPIKVKKKSKKDEPIVEVTPEETVEAVTKLRSEFVVGYPALKVTGRYKTDAIEGETQFTLATGIDILDRNSLKRLEESNPEVYLVTWAEGPNLFRYATIIRAGEDVGIWAGVHSNLRVITSS